MLARLPRTALRVLIVSKTNLVVSVPTARLHAALAGVPDGVELIAWDMSGPAPREDIDLVVAPYMSAGASELGQLNGMSVRLVQSQSIGYDGVEASLPANLVFANATSVHEASTAELTLALILASQRGIPDFVRAAGEGKWAPAFHTSLADRTVLLVGVGGVGVAIEDRLIPFETTVVRVARTARSDDRGDIHSFDELPDLLPAADIVVIGVPLTDSTRHMVDDAFLSRMADGSLLVNIARGPVVDTEALLKHTTSGRLRAALDVTDPEPLPEGHPLFALPNVLISPHVGGATTAMEPRMVKLILRQIERLQTEREPVNIVVRS